MNEKRQFNRTYELVISDPKTSKGLRIVGNEDKNDGLQISFSIKKHIDNKNQSNTCDIKITNLSNDTINFLRERNLAVVFKVGYDDDNKVLFTGMTTEVDEDDNYGSVDKVTSIKCVPANTVFYSPIISKTFPAETTPRSIIEFLVGQDSNLNLASINSKNIDVRFPFGYPIEGTVKQVLDELSRDYNFNYRIDGKRLYINDPNTYQSSNSAQSAFVISPDTGLIGLPTFATADGKKPKKDQTAKNGVKFTALINALIQPGQAVSIKDTEISGIYRVNSAEFKGDWRGGGWYVVCHCSKLNAKEI